MYSPSWLCFISMEPADRTAHYGAVEKGLQNVLDDKVVG